MIDRRSLFLFLSKCHSKSRVWATVRKSAQTDVSFVQHAHEPSKIAHSQKMVNKDVIWSSRRMSDFDHFPHKCRWHYAAIWNFHLLSAQQPLVKKPLHEPLSIGNVKSQKFVNWNSPHLSFHSSISTSYRSLRLFIIQNWKTADISKVSWSM